MKATSRRNQSTNNEQHSTHYSFIRHSFQTKIILLQVGEYFFWVSSKNCLTGETVMKHLRRKIDSPKQRITVWTLFSFHLLFVVSSVFRRYSRIVYSGLNTAINYFHLTYNFFKQVFSSFFHDFTRIQENVWRRLLYIITFIFHEFPQNFS